VAAVSGRVVRAAGGVVWRPGPGDPEVVLVHRPRYDDWSLPKGKLAKGEHPLLGAVREVFEETGVHAVPQVRLPSTRYLTGVPDVEKVVDYWSMRRHSDEAFEPNDEVDEVRWFEVPAAARQLTYGHDRGVLAAFAAVPPVTGLVVLVRHTSAGERGTWPGPDERRPLDGTGRADAEALAELLTVFRPVRVISASPVRCLQTVEPLAARTGLPVEVDERFDEDADPVEAAKGIRALAEEVPVAVVCSQGRLIPPVLQALTGSTDAGRYATAKGDGWVLAFAGTSPVATDRLGLRVPPAA
jgi:8-oxo-dGTP diphosphatase